jgi:ABC-type polysaccharide/polyol phosphate export permease
MQNISALNIPQSGPTASRHMVALIDVIAGIQAVTIWGRLGWRENKRRYRRTVFGPFWTTVSLAMFVVALGLVWSNLWHTDPKVYLPFLTSGMLCWVLFSTICAEGAGGIVGSEALIKQLRISYTLLACATLWRNVIVFFHNLSVYVLICIYAGIATTWATLLVVPGLLLFCFNALWIAVLLGAVCARYRDIQQLVTNLLQISLFLTPIFWSADQLTGRASILAGYNPLYHLIAIVRDPLLGKAPDPLHWVVVTVVTILGWLLTVHVMGRFRHRIVYWL